MRPIKLSKKLDFQIYKGLVFFYGTVRKISFDYKLGVELSEQIRREVRSICFRMIELKILPDWVSLWTKNLRRVIPSWRSEPDRERKKETTSSPCWLLELVSQTLKHKLVAWTTYRQVNSVDASCVIGPVTVCHRMFVPSSTGSANFVCHTCSRRKYECWYLILVLE